MNDITDMGILAFAILGVAWLVMLCMCFAIVSERLAFKTYKRCAADAKEGGFQREFMSGLFSWGDSERFVIPRKGSREIRRVYERTLNKKLSTLKRPAP